METRTVTLGWTKFRDPRAIGHYYIPFAAENQHRAQKYQRHAPDQAYW